jgi:carbon storage regulator
MPALSLTRHPNESIVIGDNIRVTIVVVNGKRVRVKIEAPEDVRVLREELVKPKEAGLAQGVRG